MWAASGSAQAAPIFWTDWLPGNTATTGFQGNGLIHTNTTSIGVTYTNANGWQRLWLLVVWRRKQGVVDLGGGNFEYQLNSNNIGGSEPHGALQFKASFATLRVARKKCFRFQHRRPSACWHWACWRWLRRAGGKQLKWQKSRQLPAFFCGCAVAAAYQPI